MECRLPDTLDKYFLDSQITGRPTVSKLSSALRAYMSTNQTMPTTIKDTVLFHIVQHCLRTLGSMICAIYW